MLKAVLYCTESQRAVEQPTSLQQVMKITFYGSDDRIISDWIFFIKTTTLSLYFSNFYTCKPGSKQDHKEEAVPLSVQVY